MNILKNMFCFLLCSGSGSQDNRSPMALWAKAQTLPPEALQQVRAIYTDLFPIEVRHFLASWIEEKMWCVLRGLVHFVFQQSIRL